MPLRFGPYRMPRFRIGGKLDCKHSGPIRVVAISNAPQQWPLGQVPGHRIPVLCGDLVLAVKSEAASDVAIAWGVAVNLVTKWRKALRVRESAGERLLRSERIKASDPKRARRIGRAFRGKRRPRHVLEALRRSHLGKPLSQAVKAKISATHRRLGIRPPGRQPAWSAREDAVVRNRPPAEAAKTTGRTVRAIYNRRHFLCLTRKDRRKPANARAKVRRYWTAREDRIARTRPLAVAAKMTGRSVSAIIARRVRLRRNGEPLPDHRTSAERLKLGRSVWTPEADELLRQLRPYIVARMLGVLPETVRNRRKALGLPPVGWQGAKRPAHEKAPPVKP